MRWLDGITDPIDMSLLEAVSVLSCSRRPRKAQADVLQHF